MEDTEMPLAEPDTDRVELTADNVRDLWSRTYNTAGKPDWSHLFPYYHPDLVFQDSIQVVEGLVDFQAMCNRLTKRCQSLHMDILSVVCDADLVFLEWKMTMSFRKSPDTPLFGSSKLILHPDGRIIRQRDYYDLWGDIFNGIPVFGKAYRKFMRRFFG